MLLPPHLLVRTPPSRNLHHGNTSLASKLKRDLGEINPHLQRTSHQHFERSPPLHPHSLDSQPAAVSDEQHFTASFTYIGVPRLSRGGRDTGDDSLYRKPLNKLKCLSRRILHFLQIQQSLPVASYIATSTGQTEHVSYRPLSIILSCGKDWDNQQVQYLQL
jgi:hypothetical protein